MKVTATNDTNFKPISLNLTLETREEAEELYNILNHSATVDYCKNLNCREIREVLQEKSTENLGGFTTYAKYLKDNIR